MKENKAGRGRGRTALSVAVAALFTIALFTAVLPSGDGNIGDSSVLGADPISVDITDISNVTQIQRRITVAIATAGDGGTVEVTGSKNGVTSELTLTIPEGTTVVWKASYSGRTEYMVNLRGAGTFEVAEEGLIGINGIGSSGTTIRNESPDDTVTILVSGGIVSNRNDGYAIDGGNGNVTVSGGLVETYRDVTIAIHTGSGNVTVSGGEVRSGGSGSIAIKTDDGDVAVSGGLVETLGSESNAIYTDSGNVTIYGGTLEALEFLGNAVSTNSGNVTVSDGTMKAYNAAIYVYDGLVTVSGGTIESESSNTIISVQGDITVSGGTIRANDADGTVISSKGKITVTGGTVEATDGGDGINSQGGIVTITGGMVSSTGGCTLYVYDGAVVVYLAGTVTGDLMVDDGGADPSIIVEADTLLIPASRNGTSTGLTIKDGDGTALWDTTGTKPVIKFTIGTATPSIEWGEHKLPLTFTDSETYDIPSSKVGTAITDIDVSGGVTGGTVPYVFTADGLPAGLAISFAGIISGTPTTAVVAGTATITVTDDESATKSITIAYGAVTEDDTGDGDGDTGGTKDPDNNTMLYVAIAAIAAIAVIAVVYLFFIRPKA